MPRRVWPFPLSTEKIKDGAITAAKVAADYATTADLDNHAQASDAHHSKPSGVDSTGIAGGYQDPVVDGTGGSVFNAGSINDGDTGTNCRLSDGGSYIQISNEDGCTGVRIYGGSETGDVEIQTTSGSTITTMTIYSDQWSSVTFGASFGAIRLVHPGTGSSNRDLNEADVDVPVLPTHSHNIQQ